MWEIPRVEYVYATAGEGMTVVTVRFKVGEDQDRSVTQVHAKLQAGHGPGAAGRAATAGEAALHRRRADPGPHAPFRGLRLERTPPAGGAPGRGDPHRPRRGGDLRDRRGAAGSSGCCSTPTRLAASGRHPGEVAMALQGANARLQAGEVAAGNAVYLVSVGAPLRPRPMPGRWWWAATTAARSICGTWPPWSDAFGETATYVSSRSRRRLRERGHGGDRQAARGQRDHDRPRGAGAGGRSAGPAAAGRRLGGGDPELRRDREGEGERTHPPPPHRHPLGHRAGRALPRLAGGGWWCWSPCR